MREGLEALIEQLHKRGFATAFVPEGCGLPAGLLGGPKAPRGNGFLFEAGNLAADAPTSGSFVPPPGSFVPLVAYSLNVDLNSVTQQTAPSICRPPPTEHFISAIFKLA